VITMTIHRSLRTLAAAGLLALTALPLRAQDPLARGMTLFGQGQYAAAQRAFAPYAASHPRDARAAFWMGRSLLTQRKLDDAVEWLEKAVELDDRQAPYHLNLGNAYGLQAMDANILRQAILARRAKGQFDRAVELAPGDLDARWGLMRYYVVAPGLLGGDVGKALGQAAEIAKRDPFRGMNAHALVYSQTKDYPALIAELERGVRQFPDSLGVWFGLATAYEAAGRPAASFELLEGLIRRKPNALAAYYQLGRVGAVTGQRLDRAEQAMTRYLQSRPGPADPPLTFAHWRMGMIYERQGRRDPAKAEYRTALALDPANAQARAALTRLGG
jgi:tetratricopeptide (TPR) repeat protein